ncbi:MAG: TolC family protein [Acidobacteriota bacterium]
MTASGILLLALLPLLDAAQVEGPEPLRIEDVLESVDRHYPSIIALESEREIAAAALLQARGGFDTQLGASLFDLPEGFYQNTQGDVSILQPLRALGADIEAGYRSGRGDFADWDGDLQTNRDGEFRVGAKVPLLRDRAIDKRRANLGKAQIGRERVESCGVERRVAVSRIASLAYWKWLAAAEKDRIARDFVLLAEARTDALQSQVEEGLIAEIVVVDNERLLAERRARQIATERGLQQAAIALSLFLRNGEGLPLIPSPDRLPSGFPPLLTPDVDLPTDLARARQVRPELEQLRLDVEAKALEISRARNSVLPELDLAVKASQDLGDAVSSPDDKGDFKLEAGFVLGLPIQRREARGELRQRRAELERLEQRLRLARDSVNAEVQDLYSEWVQAFRRYEQAARSAELAQELEDAERLQVEEGASDLLRLNLREQQTASAASFVVDVKTEYFEAESNYRAAILEGPFAP